MTYIEESVQRLRDLYLIKSPDDEGLRTESISFEWGKFMFFPGEGYGKSHEFYLTSKNGLESFHKDQLEKAIGEVLKLIPEESEDFTYISPDCAEFARQLRVALTSRFLTK